MREKFTFRNYNMNYSKCLFTDYVNGLNWVGDFLILKNSDKGVKDGSKNSDIADRGVSVNNLPTNLHKFPMISPNCQIGQGFFFYQGGVVFFVCAKTYWK